MIQKRRVNERLLKAAKAASEALTKIGVRHTLVGGLAVSEYGYERTTADVDFLVGDEAFEGSGFILTFKAGLPVMVDGFVIDYIPIEKGSEFLENSLDSGVISIPALVYMKLKAYRRKDQIDIMELIEAGADVDDITDYIEENAPELLAKLERLLMKTDQ